MSGRLRAAWASRTSRERKVVGGVALLLALAAYGALVSAIDRSRLQMRANVAALRADAVKLERNAAEIERLRAAAAPKALHGDLRSLVESSARAAGLGQQTRIDAGSADQVEVVLGRVPFAAWLAWVSDLEKQQVRVETCRIESSAAAGFVSVSAKLVRPAR